MPEEKKTDDVKKLLSVEKSLKDREQAIIDDQRSPGEASSARTPGVSSGRKRAAKVLLVLAWLWIIVKVLELAVNGVSARALDFTNPSLLGIVGFGSLIAYFFVRPKKAKDQ
jgi:hypothetical protein